MWRIVKGLYLGDIYDALDHDLLLHVRITHILNCASGAPCRFEKKFQYLHLELYDPDAAFPDHIPDICNFIEQGREEGRVLVHCFAGLSRSPSAILAYLCNQGKTVRQGLRLIRKRVGEEDAKFVRPNGLFLDQLREYFGEDEDD